jgi:hypothetical protein
MVQAWWLGSEDHLAAFLSAEAVLRKHYSRYARSCPLCWKCTVAHQCAGVPATCHMEAAAPMVCRVRCRFILDAQAFPEPPSVQKQYEDLCRMPALVEGI